MIELPAFRLEMCRGHRTVNVVFHRSLPDDLCEHIASRLTFLFPADRKLEMSAESFARIERAIVEELRRLVDGGQLGRSLSGDWVFARVLS